MHIYGETSPARQTSITTIIKEHRDLPQLYRDITQALFTRTDLEGYRLEVFGNAIVKEARARQEVQDRHNPATK